MAAKRKRTIFKFSKYMQKKIIVMFLLIFLLLGGLVVRLMYIQQTSGSRYERIVLNQRGYDSKTIPFRRGDILDAKGTILATSEDVYNIILDCKMIHEDQKYIEPTIRALLSCFEDVTEEELRSLLQERAESQYCVLRKKLPYEKIQKFVQLQEEVYTEGDKKGKLVNPNVKGVWFEKEYVRRYPFDTLACKALGFTTSGNVGIGGLEDYYNDTLNGVNGRQYGYLNSDSNLEKTIEEAVNGNSLVTSLDMNVQKVIERKIAEFDQAHRDEAVIGPGSANTAVLVMNPNNGEIIAMADSTGYNLNDPWDQEILRNYCRDYKGYTDEELEGMTEDAELDMLNALWQNFCITYTYEPGSTVKPLTVASGLDSGKLSGSETYECDGGEQLGPDYVGCSNGNGHGTETLEKAIMDSCNDALMAIGFQIGVDVFCQYQNIFNIGLRTGIDLPGEARTDTLIYTAENMKQTTLATNAFGQNYNATMVQVASAFASVINGGYYYQPHLVKRIVDERGGTVQTIEPTLLKQTVSAQTSDTIRRYLISTVKDGTAKSAKVPGYSMGGKTGTAEKHPREEEKFLVSYIGFAPAENPQVLIYVVINEPNLVKQSQSIMATTLAQEIMAEIFPYLNIFPDEPVEGADGQPAEGEDGTPEDGQTPTEGEVPEGGGTPGDGSPAGGEVPEGGADSPQGTEGAPEDGTGSAPEDGSPAGGEAPEGGADSPQGTEGASADGAPTGEGDGQSLADDQSPADGSQSPEGGQAPEGEAPTQEPSEGGAADPESGQNPADGQAPEGGEPDG